MPASGLSLGRTGRGQVAEGEVRLQLAESLPVQLGVRIDEVVQRLAALLGPEPDVAPEREEDAVRIVRAKEIVALGGVLPGLRSVHRHPAEALEVELGPAVVARYVAFGLVLRQGKADLEAGGDAFEAHHADKHRVEVGAVAALGRAGPDGVTAAPALARLVIAHRGDHIVVDLSRFLERVADAL